MPDLEQENLIKKYRFEEPWDGPNNSKVTSSIIDVFYCSGDHGALPSNVTSYYAVVDPRTLWPGSVGKKLEDIPDGSEQTILLIEAPEKKSAWAEPVDLSFEEAVDLLTNPPDRHDKSGHWYNNGFFEKPSRGLIVVFADAHSGRINPPISRELATALLTCNGGEEIHLDNLHKISQPELDWAKIYAFAVFIILSLLPALKLKQARQKPPAT